MEKKSLFTSSSHRHSHTSFRDRYHMMPIFDINHDQLFLSSSAKKRGASTTRSVRRQPTLDQLLDKGGSRVAVSSSSSVTSVSGQPPTINRSLQVQTKTASDQVDFQANLEKRNIYSTHLVANDGTHTRRRMPAGQLKRTVHDILQHPLSPGCVSAKKSHRRRQKERRTVTHGKAKAAKAKAPTKKNTSKTR